MTSGSAKTPDERYNALVSRLRGYPGVDTGGKGFGAAALKLHGKIFAMLAQGRLVVKLPERRVDALIVRGQGDRFDPRRDGRLMKEWLVLDPASSEDWLALAQEAMEFAVKARR